MSDTMLDLKLKLVQATFFKNLLEALSDMFSEVHFDFSCTGLELQAIDTSHLALVSFVLSAEAFEAYRIGGNLSMGLSPATMANAFRSVESDDNVTIKVKNDLHDTVTLMFESQEGGYFSKFDIRFWDISDMPLDIQELPESKYHAIVRMSSAKFMDICEGLNSFGYKECKDPAIIISVFKDRVEFFTKGEVGIATVFCRQAQTGDKPKESTFIKMMKEKVSLMFGLKYVNFFSKVSVLSDQVTIRLASEQLAMFECKVAEMGYIRYYTIPMEVDPMQNEGDEMQN